ncbi:unnamed protein product [Schistosoma rodhaini]|nr:unnamed protein product [Schistosoma rodhaini]
MPTTSDLLSKPEREKCWKSRDAFWECVIDVISKNSEPDEELVRKQCSKQRKLYEEMCPRVWVNFFDKKRDFELFKAKKFEEELLNSASSQKSHVPLYNLLRLFTLFSKLSMNRSQLYGKKKKKKKSYTTLSVNNVGKRNPLTIDKYFQRRK